MSSSYCLIKDRNNLPDNNGYGSVDKNFFIHQSFISLNDYIKFLTSIGSYYKLYDLYNGKISQIIEKHRSKFVIKSNIDINSPLCYIGLTQLKIYCNWLNTQSLKFLFTFPYNIDNNTKNLKDTLFWIPSYNEWYKAVYYDPKLEKYWHFPNKSNSPDSERTMSPYGLINPGFIYYTILDNDDQIYASQNKYLISGGCKARQPINAKAGIYHQVSNNYYAPYISARLCKKSETKKFIIKLYDTYGDGWGENYININDSCHKPLYHNLSLKDGYGPNTITLEIDKMERNINISYYQKDNLSYENYYEIYDTDTKKMIYKSNMYEAPDKNKTIPLL